MQHITIDDRGNDTWSQLGKAAGLVGGYLLNARENRGISKELENNAVDRKLAQSQTQMGLLNQLGAEYGLGDKMNPAVINQLKAQMAAQGLTGITQDNIAQYQQGAKGLVDYYSNFNKYATWAERNANGGVGRSNHYINHAPGLLGRY